MNHIIAHKNAHNLAPCIYVKGPQQDTHYGYPLWNQGHPIARDDLCTEGQEATGMDFTDTMLEVEKLNAT